MRPAELAALINGKVIPAVPVPFRADGTIDTVAQERYVDYMAVQDVGAVAVWAHTGRGLHLSRDQRKTVLEAWRRAGRPLVAGVGARASDHPEDEALSMAEDAMAWGADAFLIYPPTAYRDHPDGAVRILRYHEYLNRLGVAMLLFDLYPEAGGIQYPLDLLRNLLALPSVVGIKLATLRDCVRVQDVIALLRQTPSKIAITGEDRFFGPSIMWGCTSALIGLAAACTDLSVGLLGTFLTRDYHRFVELSARVDHLASAIFKVPMEGYIRRILWALVIQGVIPKGAAHDPFGPALDDEDLKSVAAAMQEIGYAPVATEG